MSVEQSVLVERTFGSTKLLGSKCTEARLLVQIVGDWKRFDRVCISAGSCTRQNTAVANGLARFTLRSEPSSARLLDI